MSIKNAYIDLIEPSSGYFHSKFDYQFGLLRLVYEKTGESKDRAVNLCVDMSGSMSSRIDCERSMTQQELVNATIKNIVSAISKHKESIHLNIIGFDEELCEVQNEIVVTPEIVPSIHHKIDTLLVSRGSTNIENPIKQMHSLTTSQCEKGISPFTFLLTDGVENIGSGDPGYLKQYLVEGTHYAFMGVGVDCNRFLLEKLASSTTLGEYRFVSDMEDVAVIVGKLVSEFLYNAVTDITITMINAEIYDYESGLWENTIHVAKMTHDVMRTFHLRSAEFINISMLINTIEIKLDVSSIIHDEYEMARHLVLQALKRATDYRSYSESTIEIKRELKDLYIEIKMFMEEHDIHRGVYGTLLNDLTIASKSLATEFSKANCFARLCANGKESSYSPNYTVIPTRVPVDTGIFQNHSWEEGGPVDCSGFFSEDDLWGGQPLITGYEVDYEISHVLTQQFSKEHSSEEEIQFLTSVTEGLLGDNKLFL
jgi:hypothetical protein